MPLYSERPRLAAVLRLRALDDSVRRPGGGTEGRRQVADGLVVPAVHRRVTRVDGVVQQRTGLDAQRVARARIGVVDAARALARQVLVQGAAQSDVQDLDPAADGEDRQPPGAGAGDEGELHCVPRRIDFLQLWVRVGAVAARLAV